MRDASDDGFAFEHVCLGGTFSPLHRGHRALLLRAMTIGQQVFVGVTDGALSERGRERSVPPAKERIATVQAALEAAGVADRAEVAAITEPFGRALEPRFQAIVVSPETQGTARAINEARLAEGLDPLVVEIVPFVLALDGHPVNGTRVAAGEIDPEGVQPVRVHAAVGSGNPVKEAAVEHALGRWVPTVETTAVPVDTGVPEQPYDAQGPQGAATRARAALGAVEEAGLGIGIEAAISTEDPTGQPVDVQYCAIADRQGRITVGAGPGFAYPPQVLDALDDGSTVGEAVGELTGNEAIGQAEGAIGFLTRKGITREELTEWAVMMALVPRLRPELYDPLPFE